MGFGLIPAAVTACCMHWKLHLWKQWHERGNGEVFYQFSSVLYLEHQSQMVF